MAAEAGGVVTLSGDVPDASSKLRALEITEGVKGVTRIINRISVVNSRASG